MIERVSNIHTLRLVCSMDCVDMAWLKCAFNEYGCEDVLEKGKERLHYEEELGSHLNMVGKYVKDMREEAEYRRVSGMEDLRREMRAMEEKREKDMDRIKKELSVLKEENACLKTCKI